MSGSCPGCVDLSVSVKAAAESDYVVITCVVVVSGFLL